MATSVSPVTRWDEGAFDFVASGCVWSGDAYASTRNASMTSGVVYLDGKRLTVAAVTAHSFTASKDTYIDGSDNADGTLLLTYTEVTNNAASPALAANSIRMGIIVTGASNIAAVGSVNMGEETKVLPIASSIPYAVTDSLGNLICPRDPNRRVLGYRQITASLTGLVFGTSDVDLTGLSVPFIAPGGRKVKASLVGSDWEQTGGIGTAYVGLKIKESTTVLKTSGVTPPTANFPNHFTVTSITTPTAGLHTYKAAYANNTTGPAGTVGASATDPCFLLLELE